MANTNSIQYHFVRKSGNAKTGPIPVTTTESSTCPQACPFRHDRDGGCYARGGKVFMHWRKVDSRERGGNTDYLRSNLASLPNGQLWRANQAGDLPGNGSRIDGAELERIRKAAAHTRGFTYTHYPVTASDDSADHAAHNRRVVARINSRPGITVNLSANSPAHADKLAALGIAPVVTVLPADVDGSVTRTVSTPGGRRIVVCPATYREDTTCASCGLCERKTRPIVGFPAHGAAKKRASSVAVNFNA